MNFRVKLLKTTNIQTVVNSSQCLHWARKIGQNQKELKHISVSDELYAVCISFQAAVVHSEV